jgi:hypothetical protein
VDQEVAKTLGELELKLQELERELTTIGRRDAPKESAPPTGRLIDEAVEHETELDGAIQAERGAEERAAEGDGFGGPPVFGGEEVPAQAGATIERDWTVEARETPYGEIPTPPSPPAPPSFPAPGPPIPPPERTPQPPPTTPPGPPPPETPPGPQPPVTPPGGPPPGMHDLDPRRPAAVEESLSAAVESRSADMAELVRFRDKLESTMDALLEEYSRLLSLDRPSRSGPNA